MFRVSDALQSPLFRLAREATKKRNDAIKKAEWWRHDLLTVARVALEGPELQALEGLGVTIPAEESRKK